MLRAYNALSSSSIPGTGVFCHSNELTEVMAKLKSVKQHPILPFN